MQAIKTGSSPSYHPKAPLPQTRVEGSGATPLARIVMPRITRVPLDLTMRPVARILRELPPSLAAYRVELSFRAATRGALTVERSPAGLETTKPLLLHPVETPFRGRVHEQGLYVGFDANRRQCRARQQALQQPPRAER